MKLALALALVLAPAAPSSAAPCPFFRAVMVGGRVKELSLLDPGCQERPSTISFNPLVRSASKRYVPCSVEGAPIMLQHFAQPGCVGEVIKTSQESPGVCTAKISQVYQVENDPSANHCAAFFPDTMKYPLNAATIFPKVDYFTPGQCRTFAGTIGLDGGNPISGGPSSAMYACNADGSVTHSKFVSADCTGTSIPTTLPKSPISRCNNEAPTTIEAAMIGKGACVPVCDVAPVPPTPRPPTSSPTRGTVVLPPTPTITLTPPPTSSPTRGTVVLPPLTPPPSIGVFVDCERLSDGCNTFSLIGTTITPLAPLKTCGIQRGELKCECYKLGSATQPSCAPAGCAEWFDGCNSYTATSAGTLSEVLPHKTCIAKGVPKCTNAALKTPSSADKVGDASADRESETRGNQPVVVGAGVAAACLPAVALVVYRRRRSAGAGAAQAAAHGLRPYSNDDL
jgi:hypothetical protein